MSHTSAQGTRKPRSLTASQIAKDPTKFTIWSSYHNLVEGHFDEDMPPRMRKDADRIFKVFGLLPEAWVTPGEPEAALLSQVLDPGFVKFLRRAKNTQPELFSNQVEHNKRRRLLQDLQTVYLAWKRLQKMRGSSRKWSEADYASQIYDVLRAPAGQYSDNRCQCSISLPQPLSEHTVHGRAAMNLKARTIKPDGSLFVPSRRLEELWHTASSAYGVLAHHPRANNSASHGGRSSFKWQSTVCAKLPDNGFEIASTFWEDKKPAHQELAGAYRQNRMSTTAALRQLHALNVMAPVFGMVWSEGTVRAHIDWWQEKDGETRIFSAAYPGPSTKAARRTSIPFHEWDLENPSDIIAVYLVIRNLDRWTATKFADRVVRSITQFAVDVQGGTRVFIPWRQRDDLNGKSAAVDIGESISSSPVKPRTKKGKQRRSS